MRTATRLSSGSVRDTEQKMEGAPAAVSGLTTSVMEVTPRLLLYNLLESDGGGDHGSSMVAHDAVEGIMGVVGLRATRR